MEPKIPKDSLPGDCISEGRCECICSEEPEYFDTVRQHEGTGRCLRFSDVFLSHISIYIYIYIYIHICI